MWRRRININTTDCTERDPPISGWFLCEPTRRALDIPWPGAAGQWIPMSKLICSMTDVTNSWKRTTTTTTTKRSSLRPWVGPKSCGQTPQFPQVNQTHLSFKCPSGLALRNAASSKTHQSPQKKAVLGVFVWLGRFNVFSTMNYLGISNLTGMLIQMHGFRYRISIDGSMDIIHSISL